MDKKTIVISAVNLVEAGTLTILKDCLHYLSLLAEKGEYRIVAIVYSKELCYYPHIEYIENQWPKKRWVNRLWFEYVSMRKIAEQLSPVYLWFSLHDTSPSVKAERRAVYCHNSYSFYKWKLHDLIFAPKIALFAIFTKYIYKTNITKNTYLVVQQEWFRGAMSSMFAVPLSKIIVALPKRPAKQSLPSENQFNSFTFIFAGSPNSHKNFELICQAAELLEKQGITGFKICITIKGDENKYARWLYKNWGHLDSVDFIGFQTKSDLEIYYQKSQCLIFPSKVESWGLPISEYACYDKPMLLADLPYTHETASGASGVAFFALESVKDLASKMKRLIQGDSTFLEKQPIQLYKEPFARNWRELFQILLNDKKHNESPSAR